MHKYVELAGALPTLTANEYFKKIPTFFSTFFKNTRLFVPNTLPRAVPHVLNFEAANGKALEWLTAAIRQK